MPERVRADFERADAAWGTDLAERAKNKLRAHADCKHERHAPINREESAALLAQLARLVARLEAAEREASTGALFESAARACPGEITLAKFLGLVDEMRAAGREVGAALAAAAPGETTLAEPAVDGDEQWCGDDRPHEPHPWSDVFCPGSTGAAPGETEQTP